MLSMSFFNLGAHKQHRGASLICAALLGALALGATSAQAITLDYRHEYTDHSKENKDRVMISDRFENGLGYSVETKFKSGGDKKDEPYSDIESNGAEFSGTYQYKFSPAFSIQPGFNLEVGSSTAIYKPSLRAQYNFSNGIYVAGRYRYEYSRNTSSKRDEHVHRYEGWLGYKTGPWRFEGNYIWRDSDQIRFNNKDTDYEYDFKVDYSIGKWTPFVQVGNIKVSSTSDKRQSRFRAGIKYTY